MRLIRFLVPLFALLILCSCALRDQNVRDFPTVLPVQTGPESSVEQTENGEDTTEPPPSTAPSETEADTPASDPEVASGAGRSTDIPTEPQTDPAVTEPVTGAQYAPKTFMYHLILEEPYNSYTALFVRPSSFDKQLRMLTDAGYTFLFADEWEMTDRPSVILTFDDGYEDNYTNMFPILKSYGAKATVFLITDLIGTSGYLSEDQIREMASSGLVSFQSHTMSHLDLSYQDEATLRYQFSESAFVIESLTGRPVKALAYPAGSYNGFVLSVVSDYFNFCYTTKSPYSVTDYTPYTIPRYYAARELTDAQFSAYISY